jgi:hypothetical protein
MFRPYWVIFRQYTIKMNSTPLLVNSSYYYRIISSYLFVLLTKLCVSHVDSV